MTTLVHLSDLHFGRVDPDRLDPLRRAVRRLSPDLVVVSGDLTQRARASQFAEAKEYLDSFHLPMLVVPGNHDVPLDEPLVRIFSPWKRYRACFGRNLEPAADFEDALILGFNSVNRFVWQSGRLSPSTLKRLEKRVQAAGDRMIVAVLHHPLEQEEGRRVNFRGKGRATRALADAGADLVLSGHLHESRQMPLRRDGRVLMIQAGTAISDRLKGEDNAFNLVVIDKGCVAITPYVWSDGAFRGLRRVVFDQADDGWTQSM